MARPVSYFPWLIIQSLFFIGQIRKLHFCPLSLRMLQVSSNIGKHVQHGCCLVYKVFHSVVNMVPATEEPQRISVVAELPYCGGLISTLCAGPSQFQSLLTGLCCCHRNQIGPGETVRKEQSLKEHFDIRGEAI